MLCVEEDGLNGVLIKKSEYNLTKLNVVANLYVSGFTCNDYTAYSFIVLVVINQLNGFGVCGF